MKAIPTLTCCLLSGAAGLVAAEGGAANLLDAVQNGTTSITARYRVEYVDQDGFDKQAEASNIDVTLAYQTLPLYDCQALIEFEYVGPVGNGDLFNSTTNAVTDRPVVADPEGSQLNRLWLRYEPEQLTDYGFKATLGRQWLQFDNQRHVGPVKWRLNDQTFDALNLVAKPSEGLDVAAAYVWNVHKVNSVSTPLESGLLLNAGYQVADYGKASVYAYLLDYEDPAAFDSATFGASFAGKYAVDGDLAVTYHLEFAQQGDYADSSDFGASYVHAVVGAKWTDYTAAIGYEVLGSDDGAGAFQFPLGTNHKFNGWVDKFLATPADGLVDLYIQLGASFPQVEGLKAAVHYHLFEGDDSGDDLGSEIDALLSYRYTDELTLGAKVGMYSADTFSTDTTKLWLWAEVAF